MGGLDHVSSLLTNHVDGVLDAAVGDDRNHRSISHTQAFDAVNLELRIHHTLVNALGQPGRTARVECSLATVEHSTLHLLGRVEGHLPRVLRDHQGTENVCLGEHIVGESDTLTHGQDIEVVGEEVQVDVGLLERVCC